MSDTRIMRFNPREVAAAGELRALLQDPKNPAGAPLVYWVVRPSDPLLAGVKLNVASFFVHTPRQLEVLDWHLRSYTKESPLPFTQRGTGNALEVHVGREKRYTGLVLYAPVHPVQVIQHISQQLFNSRDFIRHAQL